ncbi:HET-domain-containing protein [Hypoxylon sp. FL0543]|nr:HET-domain-containing protein [Hypoxylon sp. FL0543]
MRLIHSGSGEMRDFISYADTPPYAILSHTWLEEEVTHEDWVSSPWQDVQRMKGFRKIEYCCKQAVEDGLEWVWVDTCCIDKKSSAELTEAINSMFRWYQNAAVCYAYLADVPKDLKNLAGSRWFTRGWTLQELLAPSELIFYSDDWQRVGTKSELSDRISEITGIQETYLEEADIQLASVGQRMSWAAKRQTSREEDIAYCLLGIFDVNMPLIYGEGHKAFQRLQEEIMKAYPEDHTLFAWGRVVSVFSKGVQGARTEEQVYGNVPVEDDPVEDDEELHGLLAQGPKDFADSGQFVCYRDARNFFRRWDSPLSAPKMVGRTMRLELPVCDDLTFPIAISHLGPELRNIAYLRSISSAVLLCGRQDGLLFTFATIPLLFCAQGYYSRTYELVIHDHLNSSRIDWEYLWHRRQKLIVERQPRYQPCAGDIIFRRFIPTVFRYTRPCSVQAVDVAVHDGYIKAPDVVHGKLACLMFEFSEELGALGLCLRIRRDEKSDGGLGKLHFDLMPVDLRVKPPPFPTMNDAQDYLWNYCEEPPYSQEMQLPSHTWEVPENGKIPFVRITSERLYIGDDASQPVDIVDFIILTSNQIKEARTKQSAKLGND